jgi:hypothetical protein
VENRLRVDLLRKVIRNGHIMDVAASVNSRVGVVKFDDQHITDLIAK